ncbi:glycosyltransferase family 4 protein [Leptospira licerasiae]|uniref:Glycosyltransferase, group 1 family protein n=1 Tax=Leptospira licerasiae str. MMD4847 TaxID=1049971 RepID=A0ABN0HAX7_9LEPT|nr:glycosyltransferase family 1 protein [Leptospira licerasiae]EIE03337.1 glycosyltransferase, group 1 family protein [Leptospira licerasiae serovar Varillal str. VAR 010]EJZ42743.1 glycosyltransferase, group 1 family protein [Leptospira licerasiae str. MMD4847]
MKPKRIKIGFDARMIAHSGIGSRIKGLLNWLGDIASKKGIQIVLLGNPDLIKKNLSPKVLSNYEILEYNAGIYSIKEWFGTPEMKDFDLLDIPHFNVPLKFLERSVVTIHDIIPFRMKQFHSSFLKQVYMKLVFLLISKKAKRIITVSDFTAKDLTEVFSFSPSRMRTIYNGLDQKTFSPKNDPEKKKFLKQYGLKPDYLLSVGIGKEHKNLGFVLRSLKKLWSEKKIKADWVLAGSGGKLPEYLAEDAKGWEDRIKLVPYLSEQELATLYSSASLLVYPSLYEGFGFPPVEAQSCGCPVYSSNTSVLPEILEDTAFFFDPNDPQSFETGLLKLLDSPKLLNSKTKAGFKNSKRFDWKRSATEVVEEYLQLVKN